MHRTPIPAIPDAPSTIRRLARGRSIHDTSSSPEARVYALGAEGPGSNALFAKTAAAGELRTDALLHGDYCLPNVILDDWRFSGFIDLDHAGLSDRHIDVFWGAWTLWFNLHTSAYCSRFLDAYGRDVIDEGKLAAIAAMECFM